MAGIQLEQATVMDRAIPSQDLTPTVEPRKKRQISHLPSGQTKIESGPVISDVMVAKIFPLEVFGEVEQCRGLPPSREVYSRR